MNLEQTLTDELASVAAGIDVPPPPAVAAVVQQAEQSRTRSRVRWTATTLLAAAAVVAAVVVGNQIGRPDAAPQPTRPTRAPTSVPTPTGTPTPTPTEQPLAVGAAPRIPYVVGDRLYVGNRPQPGSYMDVRSAGRSALADRAGPGAGGPPVVFRDGHQVAVLDKAVGTARLSPGGTMVAWFEAYGGTDHLIVRDLASGRELGRIAADSRAVNPDFYGRLDPYSVAEDGTVVYTTDDATYFSWRPGRSPVRVHVPDLRTAPEGFPSDASYVVLDPKGTWGAWVTDGLGHNPESPESNGITDGVTFEKRGDPQSRFTFALPEGGSTNKLEWESDTDVLVDFIMEGSGAWDQYLRCHVATGRCEYAPTPANPTLQASPAN